MIQWNGLLFFYLTVFAVSLVVRLSLSFLQLRHLRLHGGEVPAVFKGEIDPETLARISRYTGETARFGVLESLFDDALTLAVLLSGLLPWLLGLLPAWEGHFLLAGLLFFGILALASGVLGSPSIFTGPSSSSDGTVSARSPCGSGSSISSRGSSCRRS